MQNFWEQELSKEQEEELLTQAATAIKKRRLEAPAILLLEMHKPLSNVLAHSAVAFSPFLAPFFGFDKVNTYTQFLSRQENVEALLKRLEDRELYETKER